MSVSVNWAPYYTGLAKGKKTESTPTEFTRSKELVRSCMVIYHLLSKLLRAWVTNPSMSVVHASGVTHSWLWIFLGHPTRHPPLSNLDIFDTPGRGVNLIRILCVNSASTSSPTTMEVATRVGEFDSDSHNLQCPRHSRCPMAAPPPPPSKGTPLRVPQTRASAPSPPQQSQAHVSHPEPSRSVAWTRVLSSTATSRWTL